LGGGADPVLTQRFIYSWFSVSKTNKSYLCH